MPSGVVHALPRDLREALIANTAALDAWKDITPLARNEFICWVGMRSSRRPANAAFAGPRRSWRTASAGPAAGRGASIATAPAASGWCSGIPAMASIANRSSADRSSLPRAPSCAPNLFAR